MRHLLLRSLLILIGFTAALAAMEMGLRVFGYAGDTERTMFVHNDDFGDFLKRSWIHPLIDDSGRLDVADPIRINDEVVPVRKPASEVRILFVGDSGTFGTGVGLANSYPSVVRRELERRLPGRSIRVINSGIGGLNNIEELRVFEAVLRRLKPDIVILGLFMANDINFNLRTRPDRGAWNPSTWLLNHSALAHFTLLRLLAANDRYKWRRIRIGGPPPRSGRLTAMDANGFEFFNYLSGELALYLKNPSELTQRAFALFEDALRGFTRLSREDGFRFGVLLIPTSSTLAGRLDMYCYPNANEVLRGLELNETDLDFGLPTRRVLEICARNHVRCFDPTEELRRAGAHRVILPNDDHPSILGQLILGQTVTRGMSPWIAERLRKASRSKRLGAPAVPDER